MPFCAKCGTEVPENTQFCPSCRTKQGEQKGFAWNTGKTIISIALLIAFVAMFIPWVQLKFVVGSVTINGWGSYSQTGIVIKTDETSAVAGLIAVIGIAAFLISLALGVYAITRKDSIKRIKFIIITSLYMLLFIPIFFFGMNAKEPAELLPGIFLFMISMVTLIFGVSYSNKCFNRCFDKLQITIIAGFILLAFLIGRAGGGGPSPKKMASMVSSEGGLWSKKQQAYYMENDKFGSNTEVSPSSSPASKEEYFQYEANASGQTAVWRATPKQDLGDCKNGVWTITLTAGRDGIKVQPNIAGSNCESLTPDFLNLK